MIFVPSFTFGLLLAVLYGALTHLILGGNGRLLLFYILASLMGFSIGQGVGQVMSINIFSIGPTNLLSATLGALISLVAAVILSRQRSPER